jgi:antirestriction protein
LIWLGLRVLCGLMRPPVSTKEACQEWIIVDYEGFEGVRIDEHESIERVAEIAIAVKECGLEQAMK